MGKNKNKKEKAQINESVQEETVQENKPQISGKVFTKKEFEALPAQSKRTHENSIYNSITKKFGSDSNVVYRLTEVYKHIQGISNATNHYKTLWVAFYGKNVRDINKIGFDVRTVVATREKLIVFSEKPKTVVKTEALQEANK